MEIADFFYSVARENVRIKSFTFGKSYRKGAGSDIYPMLWLDDPISGQSAGANGPSLLNWSANVDILGIPSDDADVLAVQTQAFYIGLGIAERARKTESVTGVKISGFSFISLRDYYDDKAAGYRFTYAISQGNPVDRCADDYDPTKTITVPSPLPEFIVTAPDGCAVFNNTIGLPNFSVAPDPE